MKSIIILFFSVILICSNTEVKAQRCKYLGKGTDPISGKSFQTVQAYFYKRTLLLGMGGDWRVYITKKGNDFTLLSYCDVYGKLEDKMQKGDSLILKLDNDKLITLYASNVFDPTHWYDNTMGYTKYHSEYPIKIEDIILLSSTKVVFVRTQIGPKIQSNEIKDKFATILQKAVICVMK